MDQLKEIEALLQKIERTYAAERSETISKLQDKIWEEAELQTDELYFLQELAGDLNFYEPFEPDRDTALGYYDDDHLMEVINIALQKVDAFIAR
jgi:hypothetical protein